MPRITVIAKKEIVDETLSEIAREYTQKEYEWNKRNIHSEEIAEFEFRTPKTTLLTLMNGDEVVIKESFNLFEERLNTKEEWIDPIPLAEEIAKHLAILFSPETSEEAEDNI